MADQPSTANAGAAVIEMKDHPAQAKRILRADIGRRWGKFSAQELTDLGDSDDLINQLVAKYGLDRDTAKRDAEEVVKGRAF